jgi:hypothetical protein
VSAREVLEELDRLAISIFYRQLGPGPGHEGSTSAVGRERAYPELPRAPGGEDAGAAQDDPLRAQPAHAGHLPEKAGGRGVRNDTLGLLFFLVALLATVAMGRYYVLGVLQRDRVASRSAAVGFLVFGAAAVWSLVGVLT